MASKPRTLYEKIWDQHVVDRLDDGTCLIYIDRHLVHEVTSPQAFEALRLAGRTVRRPDLTLAVPDHNLPTTKRIAADGSRLPIEDTQSAAQLAALERNAPSFGIDYIDATAPEQGFRCQVPPSFAATATPPRTAGLAPWHSVSGRARSSMCSRPRRYSFALRKPWRYGWMECSVRALLRKT